MKKIIITGLVCLLSALNVACDRQQAPEFQNSLVYPQAKAISPFSLIDSKSSPYTLENIKGHWSIVFLGYTFCPDICPTTLMELKNVYPQLKALNNKVQVILVSADPKRDTPEQLDKYINYFHPEFIAVTAQHDKLLPFTRELGLVYAMTGEGEDYLVNHSASIVIINPDGKISAVSKPNFSESIPKIDYLELLSLFESLSS